MLGKRRVLSTTTENQSITIATAPTDEASIENRLEELGKTREDFKKIKIGPLKLLLGCQTKQKKLACREVQDATV